MGIILEELGAHEISRLEKASRRELLKGKLPLITTALKQFENVVFDAGIGPNNKDVEDFLWDLEPALWDAGWKQEDWTWPDGSKGGTRRGTSGRPLIATGQAASNVSIQLHPGPSRELLAGPAAVLVRILNETGFDAQIDEFNIHNGNAKAMHILIGPKR